MSVKVEASHDGIPHNKVMAIGAVISLVSLYIAIIGTVIGVDYLAFFGGIAAVGALIWGNSTIKKLCSYGIGTGVPSAGMLAFGSGLIALLFASALAGFSIWIVPVAALVIALIVGLFLGWISNSVLNMKIPVMTRSIAELAAVGALALMGLGVVATGTVSFTGIATIEILGVSVYNASYLGAGVIAVSFMLGAIALQHPFNACLGPGEKQDRTNMLAIECGFLSMIIMAVISFVFVSLAAAWISFVVAIIGWAVSYVKYVALSKRDAAAWLDAKPFSDKEE
ncbi:MAG: tetrahydromethanopterin S-methyltransferase subunit C [Methanocorpusculum sp.]|jgi:tetrahydromethanopterin S-methyltransferase subunit C|uniref:tetrahydromethanopterin S-methyltransferase subunit MtrC n=1 Tax=Methanocorpusculum sp. TaxID=2058474 RepID=UPI00271933F5|nr:tetrahydromethanopterin S-methyltransferase subunit C [Methanocorpusculum sp.]MDO9522187.1 tetrahydromethanopterin S-methyltransferase subunit C [Methanocorpusculum sp.]